MAKPRFRLRTLLIVVAVLCGLLGMGTEGVRLSRVARERRIKAERMAAEEQNWLVYEQKYEPLIATGMGADPINPSATKQNAIRRSTYYASLKRKYERAATRPWERVSQDPPEPR